MTCGDNTNNIPLGVGYNSNGRPRSLVELSSITVSSVYTQSLSAPSVYLSSVNALNSYPIVFNGTISAVSYLGAGGGGVSNFVELGDVQPGLTFNPGDIVVVNPGGFLDLSSPNSVIGNIYLPLTYIGTIGSSLISATTIGDVTTSLGLGSLAFQNQTSFDALLDTFSYGDANPGDVLIVNPTLDGITIIPSSTFGGGGGYSALSSLTDVTFNTITDGQVVAWSAAISKWVNKTNPAGVTYFSALTDVSTVSPSNGQVATFSASVNKWVNSSIIFPVVISALSGLTTDVSIASPSNDQVLTWSASVNKWTNKTSPAGVTFFSSLTDVSTTSPTHGQAAVYSTAVNKWINSSISVGGGTTALSGLTTDVTITSPINSQIIYWASASNKWINGSAIPGQIGSQIAATNASAFIRKNEFDSHVNSATVHFTEASIDHRSILSIGTNDHPTIDTHLADGTIHFTSSTLLTSFDARYLNVSTDLGGSAANYRFSGVSAVSLSSTSISATNFSATNVSTANFTLAGTTYTSFPPASAGYIVASSTALLPNARVPTANTVIAWDTGTAAQLKATLVDGGVTLTKLEQIAGPYMLGLASGSIGSPAALSPASILSAMNFSRTLFSDNNQTEVTGTTAEVSALNYTITSGLLKNGDSLEIVVQGSIYNGYSAAVNFTPRVYWGGACIYGDVNSVGNNTSYRPFEFRYNITCIGAATQKVGGLLHIFQNGTAGSVTGVGDFGNFNYNAVFTAAALSTVDTAATNSIVGLTMQMGTSASTVKVKYDVATIRLIRGTN